MVRKSRPRKSVKTKEGGLRNGRHKGDLEGPPNIENTLRLKPKSENTKIVTGQMKALEYREGVSKYMQIKGSGVLKGIGTI